VPRTPPRSPTRPDPTALPDPLHLPWQPGTPPGPPGNPFGKISRSTGAPLRGSPDPSGRTPPADPRDEPGWAGGLPEAGAADRRLIEAQIGRDVRGSVAVAARCRYGLPAVVRTAPLLPDGTPFPTLYWLACPAARVAVGRLEAAGWNAILSERVAAEPDLAAAHAAAHTSYLAQRDAMAPLPGAPGVGGLPGRVKCLHALYAHQAATGADPVGRIVSHAIDPIDCPGPCVGAEPPPEASAAARRHAHAQHPSADHGPSDHGPSDHGPGGHPGAVGALDPTGPVPGPPVGERSPTPDGVLPAVHSPGASGPEVQKPEAHTHGPEAHGPEARGPEAHGPKAHGSGTRSGGA
jgi:uncharacterized protein